MPFPNYREYRPDPDAVAEAVLPEVKSKYRNRARQTVRYIVKHAAGRTDPDQLAYILATALLETGYRMYPVYERFAPNAEVAAERLERAWRRGRLKGVKNPYWRKDREGKRWLGRGLIQITHKKNYEAFDGVSLRLLEKSLVSDPELAMDPNLSAFILVDGMLRGTFTGRRLDRYVRPGHVDFHNARKVVNPWDKPTYRKLARLARRIARRLRKVPYNAALADVQSRLKKKGYHDLGTVDGRWGPRTEAAILSFRNDNGLPLKPEIDDSFLDTLRDPETFREVSYERATARAKDLYEAGSTDIRRANDLTIAGSLVGGGSAALTAADSVLPKLEKASGLAGRAAEVTKQLSTIIQDNAVVILIVAGAAIAYAAWQYRQNRVQKHRSGEYLSR